MSGNKGSVSDEEDGRDKKKRPKPKSWILGTEQEVKKEPEGK